MGWRRAVSIGSFIADSDGSDFRVTTSLVGWEDAAPIRADAEDKMQQDGAWDATGYYGARVINHAGQVEQGSRADALAVVDDLQTLRPGTTHEFTVDDPNMGVRSAVVRVIQGAAIEWASPVRFTYNMQLRAADPFKYGPATFAPTTLAAAASGTGRTWPRLWPRSWGVTADSTAGTAVAPNAGTAAYWPALRVRTGIDCLNPVIRLAETGDSLTFNGTIPAGQWIDIDAGSRGVTFGAGMTDVRHLVDVSGLWLAVPVGGATYSLDADSGDSSTVLEVYGYEGAWS